MGEQFLKEGKEDTPSFTTLSQANVRSFHAFPIYQNTIEWHFFLITTTSQQCNNHLQRQVISTQFVMQS